ncbi:MAG: hypothetical protein M5R40_25970 [Anaerolineae bacterium]|nr:hypothetical protein [Anaerolineae bacterium]
MPGTARRAGVALEPGLTTAILDDVSTQPGALPLLQYALTDLFEHRQGGTLTLAAYRALGGVRGALARRAEALYAGLEAAGQEAARQLFLRLLTLGEGTEETRRRARQAEILSAAGGCAVMEVVIDAFGRRAAADVRPRPSHARADGGGGARGAVAGMGPTAWMAGGEPRGRAGAPAADGGDGGVGERRARRQLPGAGERGWRVRGMGRDDQPGAQRGGARVPGGEPGAAGARTAGTRSAAAAGIATAAHLRRRARGGR